MSREKILIVDDDTHIVELTCLYLESEGFKVVSAGAGNAALQMLEREKPALVVLDLMLPEMDGWEVCRRIRTKSHVPIIMLTARTEDIDKIVGLELGADDYVTKPFNPRELVARVKAVLRRSDGQSDAEDEMHLGGLKVLISAREAIARGKVLPLRAKEFDLLVVFLQHRGTVLSRQQLLDLVWGFDYYGETRTIDVHVARLRRHLVDSGANIDTVWGVGYKLVEA